VTKDDLIWAEDFLRKQDLKKGCVQAQLSPVCACDRWRAVLRAGATRVLVHRVYCDFMG
jgi:hypothetical protein